MAASPAVAAEAEAAEAEAPGNAAAAAVLRGSPGATHHERVDAAWDREDVTTLLIMVADINVNMRAVRELLEENDGEEPEDDA